MKKCIFSWFGFVLPIPVRLELIKESGFEATCLWWEDETYPKTIKTNVMPEMVKNAGLSLDNIHCPYDGINSLWNGESSSKRQLIDMLLKCIDDCSKYKIKNMVVHVSDEGFEGVTLSGIKSFEKLIKRAEDSGVQIALENTRDWDLIDFILNEIDSPLLGMCYDSSHDWITGQSKGELLKKWSHRLLCTHLSDNDTKEDRHWLPRDGEVDWMKIMPFVLESNIDSITMELLSSKRPIDEPDEYLDTAYHRLEKLIADTVV